MGFNVLISRFHDSFRFATQRVVFALAFVHYFTAEKLISLAAVADTIGICSDGKEGFHLDLEDYLFGILLLVTELSRFIVNAVAAGDNRRPFQVADFVRSIDANFRLLNLKNDSLRRKFDTLKYDLQKCDQVVYDLSIRGLRPKNLLDSNPLKTNSDSNDVSASPPKVAKMSED
uniref:Translin n=1 Tax=Syphacia muris TaxID=451379 RepID=A0A0N5AM42_9BILA